MFALEGEAQTLLRASLAAVLFLAKHTLGDGNVLPDCQALFDKLRALPVADLGAHADLLWQIDAALKVGHGSMKFTKVTAHQEVDCYADGREPIGNWIGNHFSDRLESEAASLTQVSGEVTGNYHY